MKVHCDQQLQYVFLKQCGGISFGPTKSVNCSTLKSNSKIPM